MEPRVAPGQEAPTQDQLDLEATLAAADVSDGLLGLDPAEAARDVAGWAARIRATGNADLFSVADDLEALETELTLPGLDGRAVGVLLIRLGTGTTLAAATAAPVLSMMLARLAGLLRTAGQALAGPADTKLGASDAG